MWIDCLDPEDGLTYLNAGRKAPDTHQSCQGRRRRAYMDDAVCKGTSLIYSLNSIGVTSNTDGNTGA